MSGALDLYRFQNLAGLTGVLHAVSGRGGGVSTDRFASLNVSYTMGDDPANVDENLRRLARSVGTEAHRLFAAYQVHGNRAVVVDGRTEPRPRCDVLATAWTERFLMLRFADCTPVLLADPVRRAVALAHAGWRGSAVHAARAAVQVLQDAFGASPHDLVGAIGPAIGPCCYTVGADVEAAFEDRQWALRRDGRGGTRLDLWESNRRDLVEAGVPAVQIELAAICTRCQADRFFSHRAFGGQPAGRFAAVIGLAA